jgi:fatty acid-binding protein DegV
MSATLGNVFGVHPIIYMSDEGQLVNIAKVKGKKSSLRKLVSYVEELGDDIKAFNVIIAHTDNIELATLLKNMLIEKFGDDLTISFSVVNPTIGGHCGPDCIGVSFHSKKR